MGVRDQLPLGKELSQYLTKAPFQQIKMVNIEGVYTRTEEKDYDKFLSALGVGFLLTKALQMVGTQPPQSPWTATRWSQFKSQRTQNRKPWRWSVSSQTRASKFR